MKETIKKITGTVEITEYVVTCSKCGKKMKGSTESQVKHNLKIHKIGKDCKNA